MRLITAALLLAVVGSVWAEDAADTAIARAVSLLQGELTRAPDDSTRGKLQRAIADLEAHRGAPDEAAQDATAPAKPLTKKDLQGVISAPFQLKGDMVTIGYTWQGAKELADWEAGGPDPEPKGGALLIGPGGSMTHKVRFAQQVEIRGEIALQNREGKHLASTGGLAVQCGNYNAWFVEFLGGGARLGRDVFDQQYNRPSDPNLFLPFTLTLGKGAATLTWDRVKVGNAYAQAFGGLVLQGGSGGNRFRSLVISGQLDMDWAQAAIARVPPKK